MELIAEDGLPKDVKTEKVWNSFNAVAVAEGFGEGEDATPEEKLQAWGWLIKSGLCWSLQGWFGRTAQALINNRVISEKGEVLQPDFIIE